MHMHDSPPPFASLQLRQDSSVEPRAYRPARWPPSTSPTTTPTPPPPPPLPLCPNEFYYARFVPHQSLPRSHVLATTTTTTTTVMSDPPRRFPRSLTAPITRLPTSFSPASDLSDLSQHHFLYPNQQHPSHQQPTLNKQEPVVLSQGLSPSLRQLLPHPKAVRPRPLPTHSDLSAASTRAELEPTALRDLRRVTAPTAMLDPAQYEYDESFDTLPTPPPLQQQLLHHHQQVPPQQLPFAAPPVPPSSSARPQLTPSASLPQPLLTNPMATPPSPPSPTRPSPLAITNSRLNQKAISPSSNAPPPPPPLMSSAPHHTPAPPPAPEPPVSVPFSSPDVDDIPLPLPDDVHELRVGDEGRRRFRHSASGSSLALLPRPVHVNAAGDSANGSSGIGGSGGIIGDRRRMSEGVLRRDRWSSVLLSDVRRSRHLTSSGNHAHHSGNVPLRTSRLSAVASSLRNWLFSRDRPAPPAPLNIPDRLRDMDNQQEETKKNHSHSHPDRLDTPLHKQQQHHHRNQNHPPPFRNERHPPDDPLPLALRRASLDDATAKAKARAMALAMGRDRERESESNDHAHSQKLHVNNASGKGGRADFSMTKSVPNMQANVAGSTTDWTTYPKGREHQQMEAPTKRGNQERRPRHGALDDNGCTNNNNIFNSINNDKIKTATHGMHIENRECNMVVAGTSDAANNINRDESDCVAQTRLMSVDANQRHHSLSKPCDDEDNNEEEQMGAAVGNTTGGYDAAVAAENGDGDVVVKHKHDRQLGLIFGHDVQDKNEVEGDVVNFKLKEDHIDLDTATSLNSPLGRPFDETVRVDARYNKELVHDMRVEEKKRLKQLQEQQHSCSHNLAMPALKSREQEQHHETVTTPSHRRRGSIAEELERKGHSSNDIVNADGDRFANAVVDIESNTKGKAQKLGQRCGEALVKYDSNSQSQSHGSTSSSTRGQLSRRGHSLTHIHERNLSKEGKVADTGSYERMRRQKPLSYGSDRADATDVEEAEEDDKEGEYDEDEEAVVADDVVGADRDCSTNRRGGKTRATAAAAAVMGVRRSDEESVMSALTNEEDDDDPHANHHQKHHARHDGVSGGHSESRGTGTDSKTGTGNGESLRSRSVSEAAAVHRRLSLVTTKEKVRSVWERLTNKNRRRGGLGQGQGHDQHKQHEQQDEMEYVGGDQGHGSDHGGTRAERQSSGHRSLRSPWLRFLSGGESSMHG